MADNVSITQGSGTVIATDEKNFGAGLVHTQLIGLVDATDGSTNRAVVDANGNLSTKLSGLKSGLKNSTVSVGTTAVALPTTPLTGRSSVIVQNLGANPVYLGDSAVTTANGLQVPSGQSVSLDLSDNVVLYGRAGTGTNDVRILEIG